LAPLFLLGVAVAPAPAGAVSWELGLSGIGVQAIQIRSCATGAVQTRQSHTPNDQLSCDSNFKISFDTTTGADSDLQLPAGEYIFTFMAWGKSISIVGSSGDPGNNDDVFEFTNSNNPPDTNPCVVHSGAQTCSGWPNAACGTPPPPPPQPLQVSLTIDSTVPVGSKTTFKLKADASFGAGTYTFSWSNAAMSTGPNQDPSFATRTVLVGQSAIVTVTVVSGSYTVTKSIEVGYVP